MLRVYAHDDLGLDLLVVGRVEMGLKSGKTVSEEFIARFVVDGATLENKSQNGDDGVRLKFSRVWSVRFYGYFPYRRPGQSAVCTMYDETDMVTEYGAYHGCDARAMTNFRWERRRATETTQLVATSICSAS